MLKKFYSQDKQDEYLENNVFKEFKNGFFVDVGAHDGISFNNTLYFQNNNNWNGINIEANPNVFTKLNENRPNNINLNVAATNENTELDFICNSGYTEMLSGLAKCYHSNHYDRLKKEINQFGGNTNIIKVKSKRLEDIFDEHNVKHIHLLSIDVEGGEFDVLKSINFEKVFIDVIVFEQNYENNEIIDYIIDKNFKIIHKSQDIYVLNNKSQFTNI